MAFRFAARRLALTRPAVPARAFHSTPAAFVKVGDAVPEVDLVENSPGNKVNLAEEFGKVTNGLIIGVPAAFSPACSASHIPSYINHPKLKEAGPVFVVSVNDPFVMKAWGDQLDPAAQTGIRFLGDPSGEFTRAFDVDFDSKAIFGNDRSKRYTLVIENGKVKEAHVEPDNIGTADHRPRTLLCGIPTPQATEPDCEHLCITCPALPSLCTCLLPQPWAIAACNLPIYPSTHQAFLLPSFGSDPRSPISVIRVSPAYTIQPVSAPSETLPSPPSAVGTIPPTTRKRKAAEATISSNNQETATKKRIASAAGQDAPPTPVTTASNGMDSEEDFMSAPSSDDEIMQDDSGEDMSGPDDFDEDDFEDEPEDLGMIKDSDNKKKVAYDISFKVYEPKDIQRQQDDMIDEVNMILNIRKEDVAILLRHFRWNKERLIEDYMDAPNKVLEAAGLGSNVAGPPKLEAIPGFMCDICCEDEEGLQTFSLKCGHRYCVDCYRQYLTQKIREEGEAARIQCPAEGCGRIIDSKSLDLLVAADLNSRYHELLNRTYVEDKEILKWCPAPDCPNAVECAIKKKDLDRIVPTVACGCGHRFCFGCILTDHQPAPCELVKRWLKKCADDSETANWISANTKECPKCNSTIEKNGGCNHMTCRKCKHEFCWMCMGLWSEHGTSWYNCNRFEEKSGTDARDAQAKSRISLERYLHYYNRYANHEQSAKLDKDIYHKTEKKMVQLQTASGMSWIEVQYLNQASQTLQTCRQTLKWTYAFAFYLARNNLTEIFEDNQKDLEMAVEALSEMFEKPVQELCDKKLKVDIMDKTSYCKKRRIILLEDTADNLANGRWTFNVDLHGPSPVGATSSRRQ
ncbi:IBR domain-containing protein [Colletotrichum scovillei]|uniref:RBR-type E3 ubiquitin transferase n=2 Tax=Colletotrichum scovillei TaxID=1209932 RepID=A0A9P7QXA3_9PEZI|nr:IBR domain-containing protein [Colletotrichum scovillei]KAG7043338.1 IBR domain-containing protein [Colletotrichum scovillei]KAG7062785.1 IBR domain-containing protein [Colletotrichum scovillei]